MTLWVEKYRPKSLDDYVWTNDLLRSKVDEWLTTPNDRGIKTIENVMFSGGAGTGKTSLAYLILKLLGVESVDILYINASRVRRIDDLQEQVSNFLTTSAWGDMKYVILDEADAISPHAQKFLRAEIELLAEGVRFILTCVAPDTKIYTERGWRLAKDVNIGDRVSSGHGQFLTNKAIRKTTSKRLLEIETTHGHKISITPNHLFLRGSDWHQADGLQCGDRITVSLKDMVGMDHACDDNDSPVLDKGAFVKFLKNERFVHEAIIQEVYELGFFIPPCYFDAIRRSDLDSSLSVADLAKKLQISGTAARQVLTRLVKTGLVSTQFSCNGSEKIYSADWAKVLNFIDEKRHAIQVANDLPLLPYAEFYYDTITTRNKRNTIEQIVESVKGLFENEKNLRTVLGRISGFLCGDGHLSRKGMHFSANDADVLRRVINDLNVLRPDHAYYVRSNGRNTNGVTVQFSDLCLSLIFQYLHVPVGNKVNVNFSMPTACHASIEFGRAFVQALFDCDASTLSMAHKDRTVGGITLRQNTKDFSASFHNEIVAYLLKHFGIQSSLYVGKPFKVKPSPVNSSEPKDKEERISSSICIHNQEAILKFIENIGSFYEKKNFRPDLLGYLRYKSQIQGTNDFMSLSQWRDAFDYKDGCIQDKIIAIRDVPYDGEVYDCCFEEIHSYVTNGFVSHNCNYPNKIIPALHSRFQHFEFKSLDKDEYLTRVATVLVEEGVSFDDVVFMSYIDAFYPDLRKCINECQKGTIGKTLQPTPETAGAKTLDWMVDAVALFKQKRFKQARTLIVEQTEPEEFESVFRWLYEHVDLFSDGVETKEDQALIVIRNGLAKQPLVADFEINLSATISELCQIAREES